MEKNICIEHNMCFHVKFKHESTKHACFHLFSPFSASFYPPPPLHHNGKGSVL